MRRFIMAGVCALLSAGVWAIGASQEWVRHYISSAAPTTNIVDSMQAIIQGRMDDELHVDADGRVYFRALECIDGIWTNTVHYLTPTSASVRKGTHMGAIVTDSNDPMCPVGEMWAFAQTSAGLTQLVNGGRKMTAIESGGKIEIHGEGNVYGVAPVTNKACVVETKDGGGNVLRYFRIEPVLMWEETWTKLAAASGCSYDSVPTVITWARDAECAETAVDMTFNAPVARMFMMRNAGGFEQQPTTITIQLKATPDIPYFPTIAWAAANGYTVNYYGENVVPTEENCWAEPSTTTDPADWNNLENWVVLPQNTTVYYQADDGLWYPTEKKVRTLKALVNLLAGYPDVRIPPRPWPGFSLVAKEDCRKSGDHIYGAGCECINCGHQRDHVWGNATESSCARCVNHHDDYTIDRHGQKKKSGTKNIQCAMTPKQAGGEVFDLALHGGWHHQHVEGDEEHNCSCECGFYAANGQLLAHSFPYTDGMQIDDWSKYDKDGNMDGIHHFAVFECVRCRDARMEIKERHEIALNPDEREPGSCERVDNTSHNAVGHCKKCGYGETEGEDALILEPHDLNDECWCDLCQTFNHNFHSRQCGRFANSYCIECGKENEDGVAGVDRGHDYGVALNEHDDKYRTHHQCYCELGELQEHTFVNGECEVCGVREKQGVKCASKKKGPKAPGGGGPNDADVHTGDRSDTGGFFCITDPEGTGGDDAGGCPDCGGHFFHDFPTAKHFMHLPGAWSVRIAGAASTVLSWQGKDAALTNTLRNVSAMSGIIQSYRRNIGASVEINIHWAPQTFNTVTVEGFYFLPTTSYVVYGETWSNTATYSGVIVSDPDWGTVIEWK